MSPASNVRRTQCLSYQGSRLIKFHWPATHPAHTVSKTPQSAGQKGCFGWQICMPSGFLELSPSCTIPSPAPSSSHVHSKACGSALFQRPQMILYSLVSPLVGIESPPLRLMTVKSLLGLSAPKPFRTTQERDACCQRPHLLAWGTY